MKTLVIGASPNSERFSYMAVEKLMNYNHEVIALGIREGMIGIQPIVTGKPELENIDTVTLYVGPANLGQWKEYIISLKPRRVIFNPGTEDRDFEIMLKENGIETCNNCTLVMLSQGIF